MDDSEYVKTPPMTWADRIQVGASEIMYLVGLVLLFAGFWVWMGLGQALTISGAVLVLSAVLNGIVRENNRSGA